MSVILEEDEPSYNWTERIDKQLHQLISKFNEPHVTWLNGEASNPSEVARDDAHQLATSGLD